MPYSIHKGVKTYYEVYGEGPPLLLMHATPWDHTMWLYQIAHFSTWFRVIAPDSRCFGRSDMVREPFAFDDIVDDTIALCEKENVADALMMGVSLGSRLGFCLAHNRPDMFKAVVLVGGNAQASQTAGTPSDQRRAERIRRYREEPIEKAYDWQLRGTLKDDWPGTPLGKYVVQMMMEKTPQLDGYAMSNIFESSSKKNLEPLLPDIRIPVLIVTGEFDRSVKEAAATAKMIPGGRHVIVPGTGHCCCVEDPAAFDTMVIDWFTSLGMMPKIATRG